MHNIDRVRQEVPLQSELFEAPDLESERSEYEDEGPYQHGQLWGETENMELASEMLELSNESELENFILDLVTKVAQPLKLQMSDEKKRALVNILKGTAKQILPGFGSNTAARAGRIFGLELEGMSNEDREFEVARRFVDFAGQAAQNAARAVSDTELPKGISVSSALASAVAAANAAAARHAPGLPPIIPPSGQPTRRGRWERDGNRIILYGV